MSKLPLFISLFLLSIPVAKTYSFSAETSNETFIISDAEITKKMNTQSIKGKLYRQYQQWKGTKYKYGGLSRTGIDCSGLIYKTYREQLGKNVPRTTDLQVKTGKKIARSELRAGDLVFFKTGSKVRHVGIYIEGGKFLHVSTKAGVKISKLTDYYWKDKYWHARRVVS